MSSRLYRKLQASMVHAAEEAGIIALRHFRKRITLTEKSPKDFVTEVDKRSEAKIIQKLRCDFPSATVIGEETGLDQKDGEIKYVIDPLDATTNFVNGSPEWSIMIASYCQDNLVVAVIYLPVTGEMFVARKGEGAFANKRRIRASQIAELENADVSLNRSNFPPLIVEPTTEAFRRIVTQCHSFRDLGTAGIEYSRVARGWLHGIVTPIAESVHVAGYLLMQEAGVSVTDIHGVEASLDSKTIVAANPLLHPKLLDLMRGINFEVV